MATTLATLATDPTIQPTAATTAATTEPGPFWFYFSVEDCDGMTWTAKSQYDAPRFTFHDSMIMNSRVGPGPYMILSPVMGPDNQLILDGPSSEACGGGKEGPGEGGFGGFE